MRYTHAGSRFGVCRNMWVISDQALVFVIKWGGSSGLKQERGPCVGVGVRCLVHLCASAHCPPCRHSDDIMAHDCRTTGGMPGSSLQTEGEVGRWLVRAGMWPRQCGPSAFRPLLRYIPITTAVIILKEDIRSSFHRVIRQECGLGLSALHTDEWRLWQTLQVLQVSATRTPFPLKQWS